MELFNDYDLSNIFQKINSSIEEEISSFSNEKIISANFDEWVNYYCSKYTIELIVVYKDSVNRNLSETTIQKFNPFSQHDQYEPKFWQIPGYRITFKIAFDGDETLLKSHGSIWHSKKFEVDQIISPTDKSVGYLLISMDYAKDELKNQENVENYTLNKFAVELNAYIEAINEINDEVKKFNDSIKPTVNDCLKRRKEKANDFISIGEKLNIPLALNPDSPNSMPVILKKKTLKTVPMPSSSAQRPSQEYSISDNDYINIKNIINMSCVSMERSAKTFNKLEEEELRDVILSNLNTHYMGSATGETFSKTGKTDIHIPFENKSAYIAECKIWHGIKKFNDAISQLFSYITWRDIKTSLIIFNKENQSFTEIITQIDESLRKNNNCKSLMRYNQNEWQCTFIESNDEIMVQIAVYDLFVK